MYLGMLDRLLRDMQRRTEPRRDWRSLTIDEKRLRLDRLRRAQHQQLVQDARVLRVVRAG